MKKRILYLSLLILSLISLGACTNQNQQNNTANNQLQETLQQANQIPEQPNVKMDMYGKIIGNEGNEFTIQVVDTTQDPTFNMTPEEKKKYMRSLSQEARMALKERIRNAIVGEEKVIIPVGTPIVVKVEAGPDGKQKLGSLTDLTPGSYVSIWLNKDIKDKKVTIYVKKSFVK